MISKTHILPFYAFIILGTFSFSFSQDNNSGKNQTECNESLKVQELKTEIEELQKKLSRKERWAQRKQLKKEEKAQRKQVKKEEKARDKQIEKEEEARREQVKKDEKIKRDQIKAEKEIKKRLVANHVITIDLNKPQPVQSIPRKISKQDLITVNVLNTNKIKYDILIDSKTYSYEPSIPESLLNKFDILQTNPGDKSQKKLLTRSTIPLSDKFYDQLTKLKNITNVTSEMNQYLQKESIDTNDIRQISKIITHGYGIEQDSIITQSSLRKQIVEIYNSILKTIIDIDSTTLQIDTADSLTDRFKTDITSFKQFIEKTPLDSILLCAEKDCDIYYAVKNMSPVSQTFQAKDFSDEIDITVKISKKGDKENPRSLLDCTIPIYNPVRQCVSVGLGASGLHDNSYTLIDTLFMRRQITDAKDTTILTKGKIAIADSTPSISYGISALYSILFYPRGSGIGGGFSLGTLLNISDLTNSSYLAGLSVSLGQRLKCLFTGGVSIGSVKIISNKNHLTQPFITESSDISLKEEIQYKWFASFSTSFGQRKQN